MERGPLRLRRPRRQLVGHVPGGVRGERGARQERGEQRAEHDGLDAVAAAPQRVAVQPPPAEDPAQPAGPQLVP